MNGGIPRSSCLVQWRRRRRRRITTLYPHQKLSPGLIPCRHVCSMYISNGLSANLPTMQLYNCSVAVLFWHLAYNRELALLISTYWCMYCMQRACCTCYASTLVHYRLVCESTVEENILKKANQKRMLGELAIESGTFTTEFFQKVYTHLQC